MEFQFNRAEWKDLTTAQCVIRCRFIAREAETLAKEASLGLAIAYRDIAANWLKLADEIERTIQDSN